jgi:hypothetical protein
LYRFGIAAALQGEFAVIDAARDVRRQHDRGVDCDRRCLCICPGDARSGDRQKENARKQAKLAAHRIFPSTPQPGRRLPNPTRISKTKPASFLGMKGNSKPRTARKEPPLLAVRL